MKPWRGEHNVYGIFMIPSGHRNDLLFTVSIDGSPSYCGLLDVAETDALNGVTAKEGYYLIKGFLRTRAAIGLIFNGKADQLKHPENWVLGYAKVEEKQDK